MIYPNRQRNASAIADEKTEVLAISYDIFENTLQVCNLSTPVLYTGSRITGTKAHTFTKETYFSLCVIGVVIRRQVVDGIHFYVSN